MKDKGGGRYGLIRRVGALLGVIAMAGLAVATLLVALFGDVTGDELFFRLLAATIFVPILIWLLIWGLGKASDFVRQGNGAASGKKDGEETD